MPLSLGVAPPLEYSLILPQSPTHWPLHLIFLQRVHHPQPQLQTRLQQAIILPTPQQMQTKRRPGSFGGRICASDVYSEVERKEKWNIFPSLRRDTDSWRVYPVHPICSGRGKQFGWVLPIVQILRFLQAEDIIKWASLVWHGQQQIRLDKKMQDIREG